jgi:hypothetical protein
VTQHNQTAEARRSEATSAHTPGPWSNERIWDTPASRIHARVHGVPVALAEAFTMRGAGEKEANARLIAAAPELLEACELVIGSMAVGADDFSQEVLRRVRAAVAKAGGK